MAIEEFKNLIIYSSLLFLLAPFALLLYIVVYNQKKRRFFEEKTIMQQAYEAEIIKTQLEVREQILQTIGSDLHDNIGQLLSLTSLTLHSINLEDKVKSRLKVETAQSITAQTIKEMRILGQLIQGDQLVNRGLIGAIQGQIAWLEKSGRFQVHFFIEGETPQENNHSKDLFLFRMTQEILNNIIRHSEAMKITIKIQFEFPHCFLQIEDDGIGFNLEQNLDTLPGMGLKNIQKRVELLGGKLNISSDLGIGTIINIFIPYP